jgi:membrane protein DedA with SNARE-associated domain
MSNELLRTLLLHYGYFIFLPLAIVEGPIVTIIAGFLSSLGYLNFLAIYLLAILGDMIGDMIYYYIGHWGGKRIIKNGKFLWIKADQLIRIENHFSSHAGKTILLGKWTQHLGAPILIACGMSKMSIRKYLFFNLTGTIPKVLIFVLIGYYFGQAYDKIDKYFGYASLSVAVAVILVIVYFVTIKLIKSRKI